MQTPICSVLNKAYGGGGGEGISAPHCEFMRQALGSSAVQSAELITSDVSHCLRRRLEGWEVFGVDYRRGTTHRCETKPTQNINCAASLPEYTFSVGAASSVSLI